MHAAVKVARSCVLFISSLSFVRRGVAFKEARSEPVCVEASASCTTESPQHGRAGSSFSSSGWRKLVAGSCFPQPSPCAQCLAISSIQ